MKNLIESWKKGKNQNKKALQKFLISLKKFKAADIQSKAEELHLDVFNSLDCLDCANCCSSIPPILNRNDINRISKYLSIKPTNFITDYITIDEDGDMVFSSTPCAFLDTDNKCNIYDFRPKACREYPHTDNYSFLKHLKLHKKNLMYCPAVYHIIMKLMAEKK